MLPEERVSSHHLIVSLSKKKIKAILWLALQHAKNKLKKKHISRSLPVCMQKEQQAVQGKYLITLTQRRKKKIKVKIGCLTLSKE